jgi:hypothetical protein
MLLQESELDVDAVRDRKVVRVDSHDVRPLRFRQSRIGCRVRAARARPAQKPNALVHARKPIDDVGSRVIGNVVNDHVLPIYERLLTDALDGFGEVLRAVFDRS